jgi:hypothetical protein
MIMTTTEAEGQPRPQDQPRDEIGQDPNHECVQACVDIIQREAAETEEVKGFGEWGAATLASADLSLPTVLSPSIGDGLPLQVRNRVRAATRERVYVIFPVAGASAGRCAVDGHGCSR